MRHLTRTLFFGLIFGLFIILPLNTPHAGTDEQANQTIEKLQAQIESLKAQLKEKSQSDINADLTKKLDTLKHRHEDLKDRFEDIHSHVSIALAIAGAAFVLITYAAYRNAAADAHETAITATNDWIKEQGTKKLNELYDELTPELQIRLEKTLKEARSKADQEIKNISIRSQNLLTEQMLNTVLQGKASLLPTEATEQLETEYIKVAAKPKEEYTASDLSIKAAYHYGKTEYAMAIDSCKEMIFKDDATVIDIVQAYLVEGASSMNCGDYDRALILFDKIINEYISNRTPNIELQTSVALNCKGLILDQTLNLNEAINSFNDIIKYFSTNPSNEIRYQVTAAIIGKSASLGKMDKTDNAIEACNKIISEYSDDTFLSTKINVAAAHICKGLYLIQTGEIDEAWKQANSVLTDFKEIKTREMEVQRAGAHNLMGTVLGERGEFDDATAEFDKAIKILLEDNNPFHLPLTATVFIGKSHFLLENNEFKQSLITIEQGFRITKNIKAPTKVQLDGMLQADKGRALYELGDIENAKRCLIESIPKLSKILNYETKRKIEVAQKYLDKINVSDK